ncbi:MAG: hypothetical protein WCK29_01950 [archaeon]
MDINYFDLMEATLHYTHLSNGEESESNNCLGRVKEQLEEYRDTLARGRMPTLDKFRGINYAFMQHPIVHGVLQSFKINLEEYRGKKENMLIFERDIKAGLDLFLEIFGKENISRDNAYELSKFCSYMEEAEEAGRNDSSMQFLAH